MKSITKEKFQLFVNNAAKKAIKSKELDNDEDLKLFKDAFKKILLKKYKIKEK